MSTLTKGDFVIYARFPDVVWTLNTSYWGGLVRLGFYGAESDERWRYVKRKLGLAPPTTEFLCRHNEISAAPELLVIAVSVR